MSIPDPVGDIHDKETEIEECTEAIVDEDLFFPTAGKLGPAKFADLVSRGVEALVPLIANPGFPIAISVYLLVRIENRLDAINQAVKEFKHCLTKLL